MEEYSIPGKTEIKPNIIMINNDDNDDDYYNNDDRISLKEIVTLFSCDS